MSTAVPVNLEIESGTDWKVGFNLRDEFGRYLDLGSNENGSHVVTAQMARNYTSTTKYDLNAEIIQPNEGAVQLSLSRSDTTSLKAGRYLWNIFLTDPEGVKSKVIEGVITVIPGVL